MTGKTRWGILGTGNIARQFATGLAAVPGAELAAVGSRKQETADEFGQKFGIPRCYASYEALVVDPDIDVIYVSTPHHLHKPNTLMALEAGKAVLCEKPFCLNVREAEEVVSYARSRNLLLMEAMWTRFLPVTVEVKRLLTDGAIGEVRMVTADFGFRADFNPEARLFNLAYGGGGLLDVGIYVISLAFMVFGGPPTQMTSLAHIGQSGVDEQAAFVFGYDGGRLASLTCAVRTSTPQEATIIGTEGRIHLPSRFWNAKTAVLTVSGKEPVCIEHPRTGNGYNYEAEEVQRCLSEGRTESALMPLDETLSVLRTMDALRAQWGVKYPGE